MMLLNLGSVPDYVAEKFDFRPGFQADFRRRMEEYKAAFAQEHGHAWEFMNARTIERYLAFKEAQDEQYAPRPAAGEGTSRNLVEMSILEGTETSKLLKSTTAGNSTIFNSDGKPAGWNRDIRGVLEEKRNSSFAAGRMPTGAGLR